MYNKVLANNVQDKVETPNDLSNALSVIADEFIEQYLANNSDLSDKERSSFMSLVSTSSNEFLQKLVTSNPSGPYDIKSVTASFEENMQQAISDNKVALNNVNNAISGYKDNTSTNYQSLLSYLDNSTENNYVSNSEWNAVRNKTVQYMMGELLNGNSIDDILVNMNSSCKNSSAYKKIMESVNGLKDSQNPADMTKMLESIQINLTTILNNVGKDKAVSVLGDYAQSQLEDSVNTKLSSIGNNYLEANITSDMTDEDRTKLKAIIDNCSNKFISKLNENGTLAQFEEMDLSTQFEDFINTELVKLAEAFIETRSELLSEWDINSTVSELYDVADSASLNGFVSDTEKAQLIDISKTVITNQLKSGMQDLPILEGLNSNYKNTADYKKLIELVSEMDSAVDADKLLSLNEQVDELVTKMLDAYTGQQLVDGINSTKPISVDDDVKNLAVSKSSIASDYNANVSRTTSRGYQTEDRLEEIQSIAKADLEAYAESLKEQLRSELGAAYVEADVQKYINDAINDTISMFTQNISRRNGHGNYNVSSDEQAFVFLRRTNTRKGKYVYNLQSLINTFVDNFNKTSAAKNSAKFDSNLSSYDKENVIADSLGNDYLRNKSEKIYGHKNDKETYSELIEQAKEDLKKVAESLKASLLAEGCALSSSDIDKLIDECMSSTITDMQQAFQYCQPSGKTSMNVDSALAAASSVGVGYAAATGVFSSTGTLATGITAILTNRSRELASNLLKTGTIKVLASLGGKTAAAITSALPVIGWATSGALLGYSALKKFTNLFGATYGQHNADAGFYFERKSHSKSGNWGYDTQTLVDVFLAKVDSKLKEAQNKK